MKQELFNSILNGDKDFSKFSPEEFKNLNLSYRDLSKTNLTAEQILASSCIMSSILPPSANFSNIPPSLISSKPEDYFGSVDFCNTNIALTQILSIKLNYHVICLFNPLEFPEDFDINSIPERLLPSFLVANPEPVLKSNNLNKLYSDWNVVLLWRPELENIAFQNNPDYWDCSDSDDYSYSYYVLMNFPRFFEDNNFVENKRLYFLIKDWHDLLDAYPQYFSQIKKLAEYSSNGWYALMERDPNLASECKDWVWNEIESQDLENLLATDIRIARRYGLEKLNSEVWKKLLETSSSVVDEAKKYYDGWFVLRENGLDILPEFEDWSTGIDWAYLISECPQYAECCEKWSEFSVQDWLSLLRKQPQFADKFDKWEKIPAKWIPREFQFGWTFLLEEQPQFAGKCNKWNEFSDFEWSSLLEAQPQFLDKAKEYGYKG